MGEIHLNNTRAVILCRFYHRSSRCLPSCLSEVTASDSSFKVRIPILTNVYFSSLEISRKCVENRFVFCAADFDVPSSREDVDRDSMWNQWLVSEIHTLFVESLEAFKVRAKSICPHLLPFAKMGTLE